MGIENKMDLKDFDVIGLTLEEAKDKYPDWRFRARTVDGKPRIVTMDFRRDRVNVSTVNNKITSVDGIG